MEAPTGIPSVCIGAARRLVRQRHPKEVYVTRSYEMRAAPNTSVKRLFQNSGLKKAARVGKAVDS